MWLLADRKASSLQPLAGSAEGRYDGVDEVHGGITSTPHKRRESAMVGDCSHRSRRSRREWSGMTVGMLASTTASPGTRTPSSDEGCGGGTIGHGHGNGYGNGKCRLSAAV